jgi:tetratricopeptide (TPR) repeat protein
VTPKSDSCEALEAAAQQSYATGDLEGAISTWEQLHAHHRERGDDLAAARAASMVALHLLVDTGLMAPVRGWVRRAERLLVEHEEGALHATLAAIRTYERFMSGDPAASLAHATAAITLGDRHGQNEASLIGAVALARLTLLGGDLDEGLAMLDEAGARLMAGEAGDLVTGMMLCELVCAAQGLALHDLAREWTEVMDRWGQDSAPGGINGRCRVHRAELLRISGPAAAAEEEALAACAELRPWLRREYGWPLVELGTIRLCRGDLDGATEAFQEAQTHAWSAQPGLALVNLARGDVHLAAAQVADAITHPVSVPSKEQPPFGDLRLAPLLSAQAEIAVAADDLHGAASAAQELGRIADRYPSRSLRAASELARARALLLSGTADAAVAAATMAIEIYAEVGSPFESARARMVLALVYDRAGRGDLAREQRAVAERALTAFGVIRPAMHMPMPATRASFQLVGHLRRVHFCDREVVLPDLQGFRILERLLAEPNREFHVLDLVGATGTAKQSGLPLLDEEARAAYRRRLADVDVDLDEAHAMHDLARVQLAERDRTYLIDELSRAVGLHGRDRLVGSTSERARTRVRRTLRYALDRLTPEHPMAGAHLSGALHTGTYCSYQPDPSSPVRWSTSP